MKKKFMLLAVLLTAALLFSACATTLLDTDTAQDSATAGVESTVDPSTVVVAEVNGTPIYKDAFDELYAQYEAYASSYGSDVTDPDTISSMQSKILDYLVSNAVIKAKMDELGYSDLSDDQIAEAEANAESEIEYYVAGQYLEEGYTQDELDAAMDQYEQTVLDNVFGMTKEQLIDSYKLNIAQQSAYDDLVGDVTPSDDDVQAKYDDSVAADQETMEADPTQYVASVSNGTTVYYVPEGVRTVKQVLIALDDDTSASIQVLRDNSYDDQADILLTQGLAGIQAEADEALSRIKSGEITFDEAIAQYNDDPGMTDAGYPVVADNTTYVQSFTDAAMALQNIGDMTTDLIASDFGYHIIEYTGDVTPGAVDFDSVKDAIFDDLKSTQQSDAWSDLLDQWNSEADIVYHQENL